MTAETGGVPRKPQHVAKSLFVSFCQTPLGSHSGSCEHPQRIAAAISSARIYRDAGYNSRASLRTSSRIPLRKAPGVTSTICWPSRSESSFSALTSSNNPILALGSNSASISTRRPGRRGNFASLRILCLTQNPRSLRFEGTVAVALGGIIFLNGERRQAELTFPGRSTERLVYRRPRSNRESHWLARRRCIPAAAQPLPGRLRVRSVLSPVRSPRP
jgi:hypothetical protein